MWSHMKSPYLPPAWSKSETTETRTHSKSSFPTKLDGNLISGISTELKRPCRTYYQAKRLVTRWNKRLRK